MKIRTDDSGEPFSITDYDDVYCGTDPELKARIVHIENMLEYIISEINFRTKYKNAIDEIKASLSEVK